MPPPQAHHRLVRTFEFDQQKQTEFLYVLIYYYENNAVVFDIMGLGHEKCPKKGEKDIIFFPPPRMIRTF